MNLTTFAKNWERIDALDLPDTYTDYLELAQNSPTFERARAQIREAIGRSEGTGVDVGCGLGLAVNELAALGCQVTGIDLSQVMVEKARRRYPNLDFRIGSALELPFEDDSLDFYRAERVYVHLPDAEKALNEAYRVLKPGGRLVLTEPDLNTMVFNCSHANQELARTAVKAMVKTHTNPYAGTEIRGQLVNTGFTNIGVAGFTHIFTDFDLGHSMAVGIALQAALATGELTEGQIANLLDDLKEHAKNDTFQCSCTSFIVSANKS